MVEKDKSEKAEKIGISTQLFRLAKVESSWLLTKLLLKKWSTD